MLLLPIFFVVALLGTGAGNQLLWNWASGRIEASSGWRVNLEDPRVRWGIVVSARSVEVTTPEGKRLAAADRLRGRLSFGALRRVREGLVVETLRLDGLWFDPAALPPSEEEPDEDTDAYPLEIRGIDVRGATVPGQELQPPMEIPLGATGVELAQWSAEGWNLEGSFSAAEEIRFELRGTGELDWRGEGLKDSSLAVEVALDGQEPGVVRVRDLVAQGEGVDAAVDAELGFAETSPLRVSGRLEVEPLMLVEEETLGAVPAGVGAALVSWTGDIDLRSRLGRFSAQVGGVPLRWA